jgi:predicted nuclease of predicted toxin-antitoxin system
VKELRAAGHDTVYMAEIAPRASDSQIISRANDEVRLLLTEDKDFGELVFRWRKPAPGVLLLRIDGPTTLKWMRLQAAISQYGNGLFGHHTVVEAARFRFRPLLSVVHQ